MRGSDKRRINVVAKTFEAVNVMRHEQSESEPEGTNSVAVTSRACGAGYVRARVIFI